MTRIIKKKFLAVILTLAMAISLLPALTLPASAAATTYTVTSTSDTTDLGTLRWAFTQAAAKADGSTITFDSSLAGATITLASALPELTPNSGSFTLVGLTDTAGKPAITINGNHGFANILGYSDKPGISALGSGTFSISNIVFTNFALNNGADGYGSVINIGKESGYQGYNTISLRNCVFSGNSDTAPYRAGVVQLVTPYTPYTITVDRCIFKNNTLKTTDASSGIWPISAVLVLGGDTTVTNSLFSGNTYTVNNAANKNSADGCAIITNDPWDIKIWGNTFYGNTITNNGTGGANGAAVSHEGNGGSLSVFNNIMLGNTATGNTTDTKDIYNYFEATTVTKGFNESTGTASDIFTDLEHGDFTLKSNASTLSTIIDKGSDDYKSGDYDLAGNPRKVGTIDIGAYESSPMTITPASALTEENLDTNSLTVTLLGTTFKDETLDKANFTLNSALTGLTVESVTYTDTTHCTVNLAYNGDDFDTDKTVSLTVKAAELATGGDLTSGTLKITAMVETTPTVTTTSVSTYTATAATMGGNVTASGGETVTGRGVVYSSTNATPTIGGAGVIQDANGTGTGSFSESISGLSPSTTYYVRAYATNSIDTSYGSVVNFTTTAISAAIAPASALTEENLDTNSLTVTLSGTTFKDGTLANSNFTLNNAPTGVTIESVTYTDTTHCTVNLAYDRTDITANVTNFSLKILVAELASGSDLTSNTLTITADTTAPTVTKLGDGTKDFSIAASESAILTFSEALSSASQTAVQAALTSSSSQALSYSWSGAVLTITITSGSGTAVFANDVTASVSDISGNSATLTLVDSSADETAPTVTKLGDGTKDFSIAESGTAALTFSEALSTAGKTAVQAALTSGSSQALSYSWSGKDLTITNTSSTSAAVFANDVTASVSDVAENSATLTLVDSSADVTAPIVTFTTINSTGKIVTLTFSEALDRSTAIAGNFSGTAGSPTVTYSEGATTLTLTYGTAISVGSGSTIIVGTGVTDVAGNALAKTTFTEGTTSGFTGLDTTAPTILSVTPTNGTYKAGGIINFTVAFSEMVSVNTAGGTPYLTLTVGSTTVHATYQSGSGSALVFRYTVVSGNSDTDGIALGNDITLNGGTIKDAAGNDATVTFTGSTAAKVLVDTTAPTILSVAKPSNNTYIAGQNLDFTVTFSEAVSVNTGSGTPYLTLTVGSANVQAAYVSGSGSALVFRYAVVSGNTDSNGIDLGNDITLNGGTIKDAAGNDATVTFASSNLAGVLVDGVAPTISSVTGPSDKTHIIGDYLDFIATFSENVTVTGSPYIVLTIGSSTVNAAYVSGSGTPALTFRYTIVSGNADTDGIVCAAAITRPTGATIKDAAGNDATLSFTPPTTSAVLVAGVAPAISSAAIASGNGYIDITFSKGVYGSSSKAPLTAVKLALTFTKNSGSATNVTISSVKKNDNAAEASASALTGGETTVRVFLSVTGSPSGTETIEIKPANATSVYDISGNAMASTQTTGAKALLAQASYGGDSGSTETGAAVIVNGESQTAGTSRTTTSSSGQTTTTVTVDTDKLKTILDSQGSGATVTIPISDNSDVAAGTLTGAMIKSMEDKDATLVVQTASGTYTLPASEIDIDAVSQQLGESVSLADINVTVSISEPSASMTQVVESAAKDGGFTIMVPAVDYTITCTHGSQTVNVSSFNSYVERTIAIPDGVDPSKITTGIVVDPDGTKHHVPTRLTLINGKYYAVISSLTNSTYSVVWNPIEFTDVASHWAKAAINDMGSRMVVTGMGNGTYEPDRNMTRAEFAAIMVRALGLEPGIGESGFGDVASTDWYSGYVKTAASFGVIKGYDSGSFGPNDTITREQAMTMIARAMRITGLTTDSPDVSKILASYSDGASVSAYAEEGIAACIDTGIVSGRGSSTIAPKAFVTRAEVAVMVQKLLQKSKLI